jgi:hypothetical protein
VTYLVESAAHALPTVDMPIPPLEPEGSALRRSATATDCGEPLAEIAGSGITVLHSYTQAGWRNTVDRQWLRAGSLARLRQASAALPQGFDIAVFDAWRPLALQRELFDATNAASDFVAPRQKIWRRHRSISPGAPSTSR